MLAGDGELAAAAVAGQQHQPARARRPVPQAGAVGLLPDVDAARVGDRAVQVGVQAAVRWCRARCAGMSKIAPAVGEPKSKSR